MPSKVTTWQPKCPSCGSDYTRPPRLWDCLQCGSKVWQPDESTAVCMACDAPVGKGSRHHCRKCGRVTCDSCTTVSEAIPEWGKEKHKVCRQCSVPEVAATMEGFLYKLGERKGVFGSEKFAKRWFTLRGQRMIYADGPTVAPKGSLDIRDAKVLDVAQHPNAFCLMGPFLMRSFILRTDTAQEKEKWMGAIRKAVGGAGEIDDDLNGDETETVLYSKDGASRRQVSMADFELQTVLGLGSFGRVMKVREKGSGNIYAMKVMDKEQVVANKMVNHTQAEKDILGSIDHPFICRLYHAFQTRKHLVLVMDFLCGGELFFHLQQEKRFAEQRAKFYAAEIGLALSYLHDRKIIYRDLKPENLVLSREGHVTLTDFGLAKRDVDFTTTFCGTPEYMAPELIMRRGHTKAVDWWSLGVLLYEMVSGLPPFYSSNTGEMYDMVLHRPLTFPRHFSSDLQSILTRLLERDPAKRMQTGDEFKKHPFFKDLDLGRLERKEIRPEFVPDVAQDDLRYFDRQFTKKPVHTPNIDEPADPNDALTNRFEGFQFTSTSSPGGSPAGAKGGKDVVIDSDLI